MQKRKEDLIASIFVGLFWLVLGLFVWRRWSQLNSTGMPLAFKPMTKADIDKEAEAFSGEISADEMFREVTDTTMRDIYPEDDVPRQ